MTNKYKPEGLLIDTVQNKTLQKNMGVLKDTMMKGKILEGRAIVCDTEHNLIVELGCCKGIISRFETAMGIDDGTVRDVAIISRVNKPVSFVVTGFKTVDGVGEMAILSRRKVQEQCYREYISQLNAGDIIDAKITHMENFGCFVDIGCGITALMPIDAISISRIAHPSDRFRIGQNIKAVVKSVDEMGRLILTHKELLGTWEENASCFSPGETVAGIIRSVESYGIFVELSPNLAGLAELKSGVLPGQHAGVYIKSIIPEKMKIKLIVVDSFDAAYMPPDPQYYIKDTHISFWKYSPECSYKTVESIFSDRYSQIYGKAT